VRGAMWGRGYPPSKLLRREVRPRCNLNWNCPRH
jgi:hypothetical protein